MARPLLRVDGGDPRAVTEALRSALDGGPAVFPVTDAVGADDAATAPPAEVADEVALVVETSGSSGRPKRVALSAAALLSSAEASAAAVGGSGQWLMALPAHYIAGVNVLVRSIVAGTDPAILPDGHFDAHEFAAVAERMQESGRYTALVPVQLARVLDAAEHDDAVRTIAARFDRILIGGQAAPRELLDRSRASGLSVTRTYGSSETSGGCVYDGRPIGDTRIAIVGGAVELSGSVLAEGYLQDAERTASAFTEHDDRRWYRTGDLGGVGGDGTLRVTGRADNVIISGGTKVSLDAVERVVRGFGGLQDAVVVSAASAEWGNVPVIVTATIGAAIADVRERVGAELGAAARPDRILVVDRVPLLSTGKPDRRAAGLLVDPVAPAGGDVRGGATS